MKDNSEKIAACSIHDEKQIVGFFGEYRWLSNFHKCAINYKGRLFHSTEAAYMSEKTADETVKDGLAGIFIDPDTGERMIEELEPRDAKKIGRAIRLRSDWEQVKDQVMFEVNLIKFSDHEELKKMLLATGEKHLEEKNWWKDVYWGTCNGVGRNQLGITLMKVRSELVALQETT